jgi:serine/threonine-protein kinase
MAADASCPSAETIALFIEGGLDAAGEGRIRRHVASCDDCRGLLADAGRNPAPSTDPFDGKYVIERELASGGMGRVFLAKHTALQRDVAIKLIHADLLDDPAVVPRFEREARTVARMRSRHVVQILDVDWLPTGEPYIVMEYLDGADLGRLVDREGPLPVGDAVRYVLAACEAISEAHAAGIVHRDLKPQNLFLTRGPEPIIKVLDFGLAKTVSRETENSIATLAGALVGSPRFMSPEQMLGGPVDARTDVWAAGATLYYLLVGEGPFDAKELVRLRARILTAQPDSMRGRRPEIPEAFDQIVRRCLQRDPEARFATIDELARALSRIDTILDEETTVQKESLEVRPVTTSRARWAAAVALLVVTLGAAFATTLVLRSRRPLPPTPAVAEQPLLRVEPPVVGAAEQPSAEPPKPTSGASGAAAAAPSPRQPVLRQNGLRGGRPHAAGPAASGAECNPPYRVDDSGTRIYKRGCF